MSGARNLYFVALVTSVTLAGPLEAESADEFAPSCLEIQQQFKVAPALLTPGKLFVVIDGALVDADQQTLAPRDEKYQFYYVFQNNACAKATCLTTPVVVLVKTVKVTNAQARPVVYLAREGSGADRQVPKKKYDDFHENPIRSPRTPFNWFHLTYSWLSGAALHTHLPTSRREEYLFDDAPSAPGAWLKARNYAFTRNANNQPQCIPLDMNIQSHTSLAFMEIAVIEDGQGGDPRADWIRRWDFVGDGGN